jgi:hypothetical protein
MQTEIILPRPHEAQQQIIDSKARFKVALCGRRFGKSLIAQNESIHKALAGQKVFYVTPTFLLAKSFFKDIVNLLPSSVITDNKSDLIIDFVTGGQIRFFTGERLDTMRGLRFHWGVIDEAPYLKNLEDDWQNIIRPTLTDYKGGALFISTPRGKEYFYSLWMRNDGVQWQSFRFTTYDNPYIDKEEVDAAKRELPEAVFRQEYMAVASENALNPFGIELIDSLIQPLSKNKAEFFGIDLAKSVDYTVVVGLDRDGKLAHFERYQHDWGTTKTKLKQLPKASYGYIDSSGVGDPIAEEVCKQHQWLESFKFTSTSKQQLMEGLQAAIHQRHVTINNEIADELKVFEYKMSGGRVKYEALSGYHDDCVMALALAFRAKELGKVKGRYTYSRI